MRITSSVLRSRAAGSVISRTVVRRSVGTPRLFGFAARRVPPRCARCKRARRPVAPPWFGLHRRNDQRCRAQDPFPAGQPDCDDSRNPLASATSSCGRFTRHSARVGESWCRGSGSAWCRPRRGCTRRPHRWRAPPPAKKPTEFLPCDPRMLAPQPGNDLPPRECAQVVEGSTGDSRRK
jgi:hypothetical protein